ncbi:MAG TPA: cytochrome c family protein [Dongiaceae bacterium]|jgi:cytochrome c|nr:cytochrome c family protein [Dongiaceae bacterium]
MAGSLELNKIMAAVLVAGLITVAVGLLSDFIYETPPEPRAQPGQAVTEAPVVEAAAEQFASSIPMIAKADPAKGQDIAKKCQTCHTLDKGGPNRVGPNLWGILGNKRAHAENFPYSDAIKSLQGPWTFEELDKFVYNPRGYAKGTKMTFAGLRKPEDRAALLAYLRTLSDNPQPAPQ